MTEVIAFMGGWLFEVMRILTYPLIQWGPIRLSGFDLLMGTFMACLLIWFLHVFFFKEA